MPTRRRINTLSVGHRTFLYGLAATAAAAPLATWGIRQTPTLVESPGVSPITAKILTLPLVDAVTIMIGDAAVGTHVITNTLHPLRGFVKDITRDEPFPQFALTWPGDNDLQLYVRAERGDGSFDPWLRADSHGPMNNSGQSDTELLSIEPTRRVQVSAVGLDLLEDLDPRNIIGIDNFDPATIGGSLQDLVDATTALSLNAIQAVFIDGVEQIGEVIQPVAYESSTASAPDVVSCIVWGVDEPIHSGSSSYNAFEDTCIHHTVGSNNYLESRGLAIVRGIYAYHAKTLGWGDIGYNTLVDKYDNIYEGRYSDLGKSIGGAHTGDFNNGTFGVSVVSNHDQLEIPDAAVTVLGEMIGWRMKVGGVDPMSTAVLTSAGYSKAHYGSGQTVNLPAVFGHRDTGYASYPDNFDYQQMDTIRAAAKAKFDGAGRVDTAGHSTDSNNQGGKTVSVPPIPDTGESGDSDGSLGNMETSTPGEVVGEFLTGSLPTNPAEVTQA